MSDNTVIIACEVMKPELEAQKPPQVTIRYLPQGLHNTPKEMPQRLQEQIDDLPTDSSRLVLAYGLCSMGVTGLVAPDCGLYIPKAHDCIAILLGSLEAYQKAQNEQVGTYWLTPGWVAEKQDPLGFMHGKYSERVGPEMAEKVVHLELQNYTHISLINTGAGDLEALRERTRQNADYFGKQYSEVQGDPAYFRRILAGPWDQDYFHYFAPGETVDQMRWLGY
jgi:hypothetical protein